MASNDIQFTRVTSAYTKKGKVFVSVQPPRPGVEYREIPLLKLFPGGIVTPQEGDIVAVHTLPDDSKVATMASSEPQGFTLPDLGENEMVFKFDNDTEIRVQKGAGGSYDVTVNASGNVNLDAVGSITIGDPAAAEALAKQAHTHDVTLSDGTTATTTQPNETGTGTTVE